MSVPPPPEIESIPFMTLLPELRDKVYEKFLPWSNIIDVTFIDLAVDGKLIFTRLTLKDLTVLKSLSKDIKAEVERLSNAVPDKIEGHNFLGLPDILHFDGSKDMILLNYFDSHRCATVDDKIAEAFGKRLTGVGIIALLYYDFSGNEKSWAKILKTCADLKEVYIIYA
ncbi:hypothetical protein GLAREA_05848 [Glarea lozoyensis ATCC 20868]|uniref:Uncharacterized protein n=1 Tax=Glarea lozoyensis (strain ATCC 20868 / MF5171) TaxID=1116229 RepID=S3DLD4_GLAL2|nr:uncharacterized protein GLAREA_05848 [Glarea lozoyensis ATCC 20868]EPE32836.1 hypothetical protein GLAREA_05848 [Glarea lozoyensis ATCC 20868]